jgi:quinol monooxygenase YgiN
MVHVVASLRIEEGKLEEFLGIFGPFAQVVRQEDGCQKYVCTVDLETGLPPQTLDKSVVTIIETWASLDALQAHLVSPHFVAQGEKEKGIVRGLDSLKILQEATA